MSVIQCKTPVRMNNQSELSIKSLTLSPTKNLFINAWLKQSSVVVDALQGMWTCVASGKSD